MDKFKLVKSASILGLLLFIAILVYDLYHVYQISRSITAFLYELFSMLFLLPLGVPALMGWLFYKKKKHKIDLIIVIGMLSYLVLMCSCFLLLVLIPTKDPLQVGLPMILILIPLASIISIFLIILYFFKVKI